MARSRKNKEVENKRYILEEWDYTGEGAEDAKQRLIEKLKGDLKLLVMIDTENDQSFLLISNNITEIDWEQGRQMLDLVNSDTFPKKNKGE